MSKIMNLLESSIALNNGKAVLDLNGSNFLIDDI